MISNQVQPGVTRARGLARTGCPPSARQLQELGIHQHGSSSTPTLPLDPVMGVSENQSPGGVPTTTSVTQAIGQLLSAASACQPRPYFCNISTDEW